MHKSRQLAAVMFTDIVGYTALMGNDERKAFELLRKNREIQKPIIEQYHGRWIKELGDGVLACFNNVSDAVHAAISIREKCNDTKEIQLRIGIHQGDVVFEGEDIFGDAVNIASRIQAIANPGSIYISESVHHNVSNKQHIKTQFVKQEILKNVREPVKIYEIISYITSETSLSVVKDEPKKAPGKSIAVLPFINMSNDPEQEYFSDGIAEDILNSLAHLKNLKIAGRTSSFFFKGKNVDLREIGDRLKVATVLEGSVRKQGNRLRITAQLISVEDGFHLWSEKYDRTMDDIFAIQDEIALAITEQLKITLLENEREKIVKPDTHNAEAYELYLKGRFYLNRRGRYILNGLEFLKQAITFDPEYALANAGFADANTLGAAYGFFSGRVIRNITKQAAEKAISLDPTLGEAYFSLGYYLICFERDWKESKKNFLTAIELNPKFVQARSLYGMIYLGWVQGDFTEAEKQGKIATKLEPLSAIDHADLAWTLLMAQKIDDALLFANIGIELDNSSFLSYRIVGLCYLTSQRLDDAIEMFQKLVNNSNRHQIAINGLIWAYCKNGNMEEALKLKTELEIRSESEHLCLTDWGFSLAYLGDLNAAFDALEKAFIDLDPHILTIKYAPYIPVLLKKDPRFEYLLDKIGFPQ